MARNESPKLTVNKSVPDSIAKMADTSRKTGRPSGVNQPFCVVRAEGDCPFPGVRPLCWKCSHLEFTVSVIAGEVRKNGKGGSVVKVDDPRGRPGATYEIPTRLGKVIITQGNPKYKSEGAFTSEFVPIQFEDPKLLIRRLRQEQKIAQDDLRQALRVKAKIRERESSAHGVKARTGIVGKSVLTPALLEEKIRELNEQIAIAEREMRDNNERLKGVFSRGDE